MNLSLTLGALNVLSKFQAFYTLDSLTGGSRSFNSIYVPKFYTARASPHVVKPFARQRIERKALNDARLTVLLLESSWLKSFECAL